MSNYNSRLCLSLSNDYHYLDVLIADIVRFLAFKGNGGGFSLFFLSNFVQARAVYSNFNTNRNSSMTFIEIFSIS